MARSTAFALTGMLVLAAAACVASMRAPQLEQMVVEGASPKHGDLNTYFMTASDVEIKVLAAEGGRPGTSRVQLQLQQKQVAPVMPVVTASSSGVMHNVAKTWTFLKNYAFMTQVVDAINRAAGSNDVLYPVPAVAVRASSALTDTPAHSLASILQQADAAGLRTSWTHTAPTNVLLLPDGQPTGAAADIMSVEMSDESSASPVITLTLDVVHAPQVISELQEHPTQTLDDHAHYHFFLPEGVKLDAAKFMSLLKAQGGKLAGLHMFAKGIICPPTAACCTPGGSFRPSTFVCANATDVCRLNANCTGTSSTCPALPNAANGTACPWTPTLPLAVAADGAGALVLLTPEEAAQHEVDVLKAGTTKECRANCVSGECRAIPPTHKCCYVARPKPNHPNKTIRDWYCRRN